MKKIVMSLLCLFSISNSLYTHSLPEPYRSINVLPFDSHGWFAPKNKQMLRKFIKTKNPKVIVEVGSWLGSSCIYMAQQSDKNTKIYAVDNWNTTGSIGVQKDPRARVKLPKLYQQFLSNVIHKSMCHKIIPVKMNSIDAAKELDVIANLIYIDASHKEEDVYNDIMHWFPHLSERGIMCGDDWKCNGVQRAVKRASLELGLRYKAVEGFWYFTRNVK